MADLNKARKEINEIDKEMAALFEKRMECAKEVALYKKENALPIYDGSRENELIQKNTSYIENDELKEYYVDFIKDVMKTSKHYQERLINNIKVAYSGIEGAFGHLAAMEMFNDGVLVPYKDFNAAYDAVVNGEADVCVLPVENSVAGDVGTVMDLIFSGSLFINRMIDLEVVHNLVAKKGTKKEDIKTIYTHPQALAQCAKFIEENNFETMEAPNTARAARYVATSDDKSLAAIASVQTAKLYDLDVIETNVNGARNNTTRFAAFTKSQHLPNPTSKMGEHFILVFTVKNEAGSLAKTLNIIGAHGYNMRNLRSRPMKELMWNYYFYVELDGNINTSDGKDMLRQLETVCDRLKLVGSYFSFAEK